MGWLTALNGGQKIAMGLIALLLFIAIVTIANSWFDKTIENAEEKGSIEAISAGQDRTLENVGDANDAEDEIVRDRGNARYDECVRSARKPGNCERYRKDQPVSD